MADDKYNRKNPALKRILQEVKEMQSNLSDDYMSLPLEENIFEWQFSIRGPTDTEFEGGVYHGSIQLPAEFPFKPPSFLLLTPHGPFETQTKICLSISNHHPEHWQPSWSVRTALVALTAFMPTSPNGALGSLDYRKEERRALAVKSRETAPKFGTPDRQRLISEIHEYTLSKAPPVPQAKLESDEQTANGEVENSLSPRNDAIEDIPHPAEGDDGIVEETAETPPSNEPDTENSRLDFVARTSEEQLVHKAEPRVPKQADDRLLTWVAVGLTVAIVALLLKKFLKANGYDAVFINES